MPLNAASATGDWTGYARITAPALLTLFMAAVTIRAWRSAKGIGSPGRWAIAATICFALLDWGLVTALPHLGLSFGPVETALIGMFGLRLALYALLLAALTVSLLRRRPAPAKRSIGGLALLWLGNLVLLGLLVDAFYIEPFLLTVTNVRVDTPAFPAGKPLRIVQLSDPHVERTTKREQELIPLVDSLEPDLIALTGDYLNLAYVRDPIALHDAREMLSQLHAPYGVYAVAGTVDHPSQLMDDLFEESDILVLDDEVVTVPLENGDLYVVGVTNLERRRDTAALRSVMDQVPEDVYTLLLYHTPDLIETAAEEGVDLYLAGHTHGGQIRLPFYGAIVTFSDYGKQYEHGLYTVGATTMYVTRGLGMEGFWFTPRVRFLCPPEVVVLDVGPGGEP